MNIKNEKSLTKGNVTILNEKVVPATAKNTTSPNSKKKDIRVMSIKKLNSTEHCKQDKMDHYVMRSVKNESEELGESDSIAFVLADGENGEVVIKNAVNKEGGDAAEQLHLSGEEDEDDAADVKEIVEHVCGKCFKSFRRLKGLKKHIDFCRIDSGYHIRKAEMLKNLDKIEKDAVTMENKDICFCCGESYDTFHLGHINCPDCPKSFKSQFSYERHIFITHSESNDYPCSICNAKLRSKKLLDLHEEQHRNRGKPYACKICGKEFTRPYHLKRHQKYSTCSTDSNNAISCNVCDKVFYRLDNLRAHLKQHLGTHVNKKPEYTCPICKNCFYSLSTLNIHTRTHTGEKPFECDLCDKKFPVLVALKKHRRYHTGEKPYTCSVCSQSFAVKEVLNRHMKRHTGEKPHKCDECGKSFIQATQLRNHVKTHFRPFNCGICPESFKTTKSLERHMRTHSKRKRFMKHKCDICQISFDREQDLLKHNENGVHCEPAAALAQAEKSAATPADKQSAGKKKPRVKARTDCAICEKNFGSVRSLQFHILKVHEQDPEEFVNEKIVEEKDENMKGPASSSTTTLPLDTAKQSTTKRRRVSKTSESPEKICKIEKANENNNLAYNVDDAGIIDDGNAIITNVKTICSGLVTVSDNMSTMDTDGGLLVKEYIVDELPSTSHNGETITYNKDSYTVILDTFDSVDAAAVSNATTRGASVSLVADACVAASARSNNTRIKKEEKNTLGASLAAAIADTPDMEEVIADFEDDEPDSDDDKPTEVDLKLKDNVHKLLDMLVDSDTLKKFGWPKTSEEETLYQVIENCGHDLSKDANNYKDLDFGTRMREYVKLLFTVVIPNDQIKELLNNYPIDSVIEYVLGYVDDDDEDDINSSEDNKESAKQLLKA